MSRRRRAALVATILALLASAGEYFGLRSVQQKADKNATISSVYVLSRAVPQNVSVAAAYAEGLIKATRAPNQLVPAGAIRSLAKIRDHVSWYRLPAGEVVVGGMFISPKTIGSVAAKRLPPHDVAVSVKADPVHSVAGLIRPGDKVDILVDIKGTEERYLYQSVPVLAVGTSLALGTGTTTVATRTPVATANNVITFAVPLAVATQITEANSGGGGATGGIYLVLEPAGTSTELTAPTTATYPVFSSPAGEVHVHKSGTNENTP